MDLLRAAYVFAGAGLDSTLKQLIRETLPHLVDRKEGARGAFLKFTQRWILDEAHQAEALIATDSRQHLIERYIYQLTGSSLQSRDEVKKVGGALGLSSRPLIAAIDQLQPLFDARNDIVHELDLRDPKRHGDRRRTMRAITRTEDEVYPAFVVGQAFLDEVGQALSD
ncbi:hypothetical protein ABH923_000330 [Leifsonia sp. EB41]|uniref:hypothetical protein n=1 Tax=Leifsonia sp. EB41 TaxID=3156260 RepID=UPI0035135F9E